MWTSKYTGFGNLQTACCLFVDGETGTQSTHFSADELDPGLAVKEKWISAFLVVSALYWWRATTAIPASIPSYFVKRYFAPIFPVMAEVLAINNFLLIYFHYLFPHKFFFDVHLSDVVFVSYFASTSTNDENCYDSALLPASLN